MRQMAWVTILPSLTVLKSRLACASVQASAQPALFTQHPLHSPPLLVGQAAAAQQRAPQPGLTVPLTVLTGLSPRKSQSMGEGSAGGTLRAAAWHFHAKCHQRPHGRARGARVRFRHVGDSKEALRLGCGTGDRKALLQTQ